MLPGSTRAGVQPTLEFGDEIPGSRLPIPGDKPGPSDGLKFTLPESSSDGGDRPRETGFEPRTRDSIPAGRGAGVSDFGINEEALGGGVGRESVRDLSSTKERCPSLNLPTKRSSDWDGASVLCDKESHADGPKMESCRPGSLDGLVCDPLNPSCSGPRAESDIEEKDPVFAH